MDSYSIVKKSDYKKKVEIDGSEIRCYSKKQLKEKYSQIKHLIVGETKKENKKEQIAELRVDSKILSVSAPGANSKLLYRCSGYACIGGDSYVALLKSRLPFLFTLLGMLAGLTVVLFILFHLLSGSSAPVIDPYNPLPSEDPYAELLPDDNTNKEPLNNGGGSVSMIYTLDVALNLTSGQADIYFKNPNASNHNVSLQLYIISEDTEVMIAESGLVKAGYGLYRLSMIDGSAVLREGNYNGKYKVIYYNPDTGERALVESAITDLTVTVTQ